MSSLRISKRRLACGLSALSFFLLSAPPAQSQSGWGRWSWNQPMPFAPPGHENHVAVYDPLRRATVVVGGEKSAPVGTLAWDGNQWSVIGPDIQLAAPAAAYDTSTGNVVLFSGRSEVTLMLDPNTYVFDQQGQWVNTSTFGPLPRYFANMTYDSARDVMLLFGGQSLGGAPVIYGDFWQWSSTSGWTRIQPPLLPAAREAAGFVFDTDRNVAVLYGGRSAQGQSLADTWEWNGTSWTQVMTASTPPPLDSHVMVYDSLRRSTVLYGGITFLGGGFKNETWELPSGSNAWVRFPGTTPPGRISASAAYDNDRSTMVLFGGQATSSSNGETWEFAHPDLATFDLVGTGCAPMGSTDPVQLVSGPGLFGLPWIGGTFVTSLEALPPNQSFLMTFGVSDTVWGTTPLPLSLAFLGLPGCSIWSSAEVALGPVTYAGTQSFWAFPIPPTAPPGGFFYNQALVVDTTTGAILATSNSGRATLKVY